VPAMATPRAETNEIFLLASDHSSFARFDRILWLVERLLTATPFEAQEVHTPFHSSSPPVTHTDRKSKPGPQKIGSK